MRTIRIVRRISNDTNALDRDPIESKAPGAAYVTARRISTCAPRAAKFIATSPSRPINTRSSSRPNPKAATSSVTSEIASLTKSLLAHKRFPRSDQDGVGRTLTALGEFRRAEALPRLERALEDDVARPAAEDAFEKFGETAAGTLVSAATRRIMNEDEEVPSSLLRRRSAAKILAETGFGKPFWFRLRPLLDERDPELVVHAAKIAVKAGTDLDKQRTVAALLRILPETPWHVREDVADTLKALDNFAEAPIEEEISRRLLLPPEKRAVDSALIILLRLREHAHDRY